MSLKVIAKSNISSFRTPALDDKTMSQAGAIVNAVKEGGEKALLDYAVRFGDLKADQPYVLLPSDLKKAYDAVSPDQQALLKRTAARISKFATLQRNSVKDMKMNVVCGFAGHTVSPVQRAGCYAPGGRFPLPSSVLMTACTAKAAGVETVWVASPRPALITQAAAYVAGADALLAIGGAQAIAAFAHGVGQVPKCDVIVGPGNKWVTAAKALCVGQVRIDMLAGPSELLVFADSSAAPDTVAADLLAQAEHDPSALPILVTTVADLIPAVNTALTKRLSTFPASNRSNATSALAKGFAVVVESVAEGVELCNELAAEHLELLLQDDILETVQGQLQHYGGLFVGSSSAEVFGDYGIGPNHTLPTGGTARQTGGLSVFDFLRIRTFLDMRSGVNTPEGQAIVRDTMALARLEGLHGHAESAENRLVTSSQPAEVEKN